MSDGKSSLEHHTLLGQQTEYVSSYDPELLCPIPRALSRRELGIESQSLPFRGVDLWTAYEVSWLSPKGVPKVAVVEFEFSVSSVSIVESKSFKLYLNSFNQTIFDSTFDVIKTLEEDLAAAVESPVMVRLHPLRAIQSLGVGSFSGDCIDDIDVVIDTYAPQANLLCVSLPEKQVTERLYSDLLKSNCPVTGQPDWASVFIEYRGPKIDHGSLLKYIVSFREHQDFHENCVERIFTDIQRCCKPDELTVYARYTRRGGMDINPFRTSGNDMPESTRLARQ